MLLAVDNFVKARLAEQTAQETLGKSTAELIRVMRAAGLAERPLLVDGSLYSLEEDPAEDRDSSGNGQLALQVKPFEGTVGRALPTL